MAGNSLLTSSIIVKRGLAVLTEKLTFLKYVNRQYDTPFGYKGGAKAGDTVSVRVPQRAIIRTGRVMNVMSQVDKTIPVTIDSYYGVDTGATSAEMAMQIDDYQAQFIDSKIGDLLANVESAALAKCVPLVPTAVGSYGALNSATLPLKAKSYLDSQLAPSDSRILLVGTNSQVDIVNALSGFFNPQKQVGAQYASGNMAANTLGFDWYQSNMIPQFTRGTGASYQTNSATAQTGSSLIVDTGTGTIKAGDSFTIAGVYSVHPQTKVSTGVLQQFTVTADYGGGAGTLAITPAIVASGSEQNVTNGAADNKALTIGGTSGTAYVENLAFSKDAFYFVTADLPNPPKSYGVDSASATYQGITLRFMQGFDMVNDQYLSRFELAFGAGILRPELACRIPATIS